MPAEDADVVVLDTGAVRGPVLVSSRTMAGAHSAFHRAIGGVPGGAGVG